MSIDDDNHSKIQKIRAKQLMETGVDYSYCKCLNDYLREGLDGI